MVWQEPLPTIFQCWRPSTSECYFSLSQDVAIRSTRNDGASPGQAACPYGRRTPRPAHRRADSLGGDPQPASAALGKAGWQIITDLAQLLVHNVVIVDQPLCRRCDRALLADCLGDCTIRFEQHPPVVQHARHGNLNRVSLWYGFSQFPSGRHFA
jgi:hypothetical protein